MEVKISSVTRRLPDFTGKNYLPGIWHHLSFSLDTFDKFIMGSVDFDFNTIAESTLPSKKL